MPGIARVFEENFRVYGVRKVWRQLKREGHDLARCIVVRLMRDMGLRGVIRGKPVRTTISGKAAPCPLDHVNRQFKAPRPNALWVSDFTYVATWSGFAYVAFTRPRSFTGAAHGARLRPWNSPPSNGWTGSTIGHCWSPSATSRWLRPRHSTTQPRRTCSWRRDPNQTASGKHGAVQLLHPCPRYPGATLNWNFPVQGDPGNGRQGRNARGVHFSPAIRDAEWS